MSVTGEKCFIKHIMGKLNGGQVMTFLDQFSP